jgi:hypothetical protein
MNRFLLIAACILFLHSCTKDNKIDTTDDVLIWPLKQGNYWHYRGIASYADGGSRDTTGLTLYMDTSRYVKGNEYLSSDGLYKEWFRSAKAEVWQTNDDGTNEGVFARNENTSQADIFHKMGTYYYFVGGAAFEGTLTRTAYSGITVINGYNCSIRTEEVYKNITGETVQKRTIYFATDKGPICFKYYTNPISPGSNDIYLTLQYTLDSLYIQ